MTLDSRFQRIIGIVLVAVGSVAGLAGASGAIVFTAFWYYDQSFRPADRRVWSACTVIGLAVGVPALWAGARLLRTKGARAVHGGSFRLQLTGPQRRRSVNAAFGNTLVWMLIAANYCFFFVEGDWAARLRHALVGALATYLGCHATILLHELGHLTLAAALGLDLQKLQVGTGPVLLGDRFGGLRIEWRAWLGGGCVLTADARERGWRWRHWFYVAAGPAATAGGCLVLAWWINRRHPNEGLFNPHNGVADVVALYLLAHSALLWLGSMTPKQTRVSTVTTHTDGWQLLHTPRFDPEKVRAVVVYTCLRRVESLWDEGRREQAWTRLRELLDQHPNHLMLSAAEGYFLGERGDHAAAAASYERWLGTDKLPIAARAQLTAQRFGALARAGDLEAARRCCEDALHAVAPEHRVALLDALATGVLTHDLPAFLPNADAWSQEARTLDPEKITLQGTRGAVLVELGRCGEGEPMLREVWNTSASEVDAAISAFYLGVAANGRGGRREARRWFRRSKGLAPYVGKWLLARIARETVLPAAGIA